MVTLGHIPPHFFYKVPGIIKIPLYFLNMKSRKKLLKRIHFSTPENLFLEEDFGEAHI